MRESRSSGSVEGVMSNRDPYSDFLLVCEVQELRVDCDRVSSLILNLLAACGQFGNP